MNISEAAMKSGVPPKTIRYYESIGLIAAAPRTGNGYRDYAVPDVETLRFIARARGLGFSVEEVGELLELYRDKGRASADVKKLAKTRIADIKRKVQELQSLQATLETLVDCCHGDERPDCPILEELASEHLAKMTDGQLMRQLKLRGRGTGRG